MGRLFRMVAALSVVCAAAACSKGESTGPGGRPSGNTSTVSGSVTSTAAVTISGTFVAPHLSANLSSQGFSTLNLSGPISGNTINAVLNGPGFNSETIVLTRQ